MTGDVKLRVRSEMDLAHAIVAAREFCVGLGLEGNKLLYLTTAVSELGRNILKYTHGGKLTFRCVNFGRLRSVEIVASDEGPGIDDIEQALRDHVSSSGTLGLGLPGVKRLMDEFEVDSAPGRGTIVTVRKRI